MREMLTVKCPIKSVWCMVKNLAFILLTQVFSVSNMCTHVCVCVCVCVCVKAYERQRFNTQFWLTFRYSCRSERIPTTRWWSWVAVVMMLVYHWISSSHCVSALKLCLEGFHLLGVHLQSWHDLNPFDRILVYDHKYFISRLALYIYIFVNIFVCVGFEDDFSDIQYGPVANTENFCF
jgi:hypothetical protein